MKTMKTVLLSLLTLTLAGQVWAGSNRELVIMSHDSFNISEGVVEVFETANNVKLRFLKAGDAGAALNQAILTKNNPMADVFFGVDNAFMSRALDAGIFEPYASPMLGNIDDALKLDPEFRLIPVDFGDVCLNYDIKWFSTRGIMPPTDIADLIKPAYKGLTVVEDPATSSPGLAFLLATIGRFGDPGYLDFWEKLKANDVLVTNGWEDAYWGQFSAASEGKRPIVV
ncbi:MAG: thiamine ABC transporter substrate-binding protein, partial [Desulfobacteraceae bacterium]|nr:thiamine ABC transporter substrate-binding protein [Desulfobacteraceae bacterium]